MYRRRYKRILRSLTLALAVFALVPVGNAIASNMYGDHDGSSAISSSSSTTIVSEKLDGLTPYNMTAAEYRALMLRSEGLNRIYGLGDYALTPVVSEISTGLSNPSQPDTTVVASGSDFDWSDASVGIAALIATLLVASAVVMTLRRHRSPLAH